MNFRYPIFLDLSGKKCLVVGEGHEIAAKVQALVDAAHQLCPYSNATRGNIEVAINLVSL